MPRKILVFGLILGILGLIAGCSKNSTSPVDNNSNIAAAFGGYTATDEQPYFGDPTLAAKLGGDQPYTDAISLSPSLDSLVNIDSSAGIYAFRIVWGHLDYDSASTTPTDWSGSLKINRGAELVRRTINFEPSQDYIMPRTDPTLIEWVSQTTVFHDGIFVNVFVPPADSTDTSAATITFTTAPFTISYNLKDIQNLDTVYTLDDSNVVAITAIKYSRLFCPKGFLAGFWGTDTLGNGIFYGNWMTHNGIVLGVVKGNWGIPDTNGDVQNIFVGKYIDMTGKFEGLMKGTYGPRPNWHASDMGKMRAGGWFKGNFYDGNGGVLGDLYGRYKSVPRDAEMGFFQGRWKVLCTHDNEDNSGDDN
ncbi:exported hypothetical protein [Candidatus Zixiibacteriota bacterium]|nr:exported hypothetical protein [candidate division Zixibacteria bacterium]